MTFDETRAYCLTLPSATEDMPFGPNVLVLRVGGKMFALLNVDGPPFSINLKCDPERAVELREEYAQIRPGYHMNKKHWNTVELQEGLSPELIRELVDHSYVLVRRSLPANTRGELDVWEEGRDDAS